MLKNDLNEFIVIQKKNYLLYRLGKDIKEKFQILMNISMTRNRLAALIQRIKNSQISKTDLKNKFQND